MSLDRVRALYGKQEPDFAKFVPKDEHNQVRLRGDTLYIYLKPNLVTVGIVKGLTGRQFHQTPREHWTAPLTLGNVMDLQSAGFALCPQTEAWIADLFSTPKINSHLIIPGLLHPLHPYQIEGVQKIDHWGGRALLADDPGLGKTAQAIAWGLWKWKSPTLILCPAFLKFNWKDEIVFWTGNKSIQIIEGRKLVAIWGEYVIANYDVLTDGEFLRGDLADIQWRLLIIDECHYVSSPLATRTIMTKAIAKGIPHIIPISATPGKSRPAELYTAINMVNPKVFPSFRKYGDRYCGPRMEIGGITYKGSSNEFELHDLLTKTVMIRRKKQDVFKQLPAKIRIPVILDGVIGDDYRQEDEVLRSKKKATFYEFEPLKQAAVRAKMPAAIAWLRNMLETEDKLVVYADHKETVDTLMAEFGDIAVKVDGRVTNTEARKDAVYQFQRCARCGVKKEYHGRDDAACDEYQVDKTIRMFIGTKAAKEGGTLTAANHVIFMELWWSVSDHEQGEDRAYGRAGDLHGATCWYLILKDSVEEEIADIIGLKDRRMTKIKDGKLVSPDMVLTELIKRHKEIV